MGSLFLILLGLCVQYTVQDITATEDEGDSLVAELNHAQQTNNSGIAWGPPLTEVEKMTGRSIVASNTSQTTMMRRGLEREKRLENRSIQREMKARWPNNRVPYLIENTFNQEHRTIIAAGIQNVESNTCIKFVPKVASDVDWVEIFSTGATGCFANARYLGPGHGKHEVGLEIGSLQTGTCVDKGVVVHELLHILGVAHEQQRPDRDQYITMVWTNIEIDKAYNMWRDSWETEDVSSLKKCDASQFTQSTANFGDCVSGDTVTSFGLGYDFKSVMHYALDSFAVNPSQPVMIPKDPSITSADVGGNELSPLDIQKLQRAYFCEGTTKSECGGVYYSLAGGALSGNAIQGTTNCEFILRTEGGKGIRIDVTAMFGGTCDSDYLEVRVGDSKDGPVVGKYCKDNPIPASLTINTSAVWMRWVKTTSTMSGVWSVIDAPCSCDKVVLENINNMASNGLYEKTSFTRGGRPIYKKGDRYLFWSDTKHSWYTNTDYMNDAYYIKNKIAYNCPEDLKSGWEYYDGDLDQTLADSDAAMRCSDCTQFPQYSECKTCNCDKIMMEKLTGGFAFLNGMYEKTTVIAGGRQVFKKMDSSPAQYLFFNEGNNRWYVGPDYTTTSYYVKNSLDRKCATELTSDWVGNDGISQATAGVRCSDCTKYPQFEECVVCCKSITVSTDNAMILASSFASKLGQFQLYPPSPTFNGHNMYQSVSDPTFCVFFHSSNQWIGYLCADPTSGSANLVGDSAKCVTDVSSWKIYMGEFVAVNFVMVCNDPTTTTAAITSTSPKTTTAPQTSTAPQTTTATQTTTAPETTRASQTTTTQQTTTASQTSTPTRTMKACYPCKNVLDGPLIGLYSLQFENDARCMDGCVYQKQDNLYCFVAGDFNVQPKCP